MQINKNKLNWIQLKWSGIDLERKLLKPIAFGKENPIYEFDWTKDPMEYEGRRILNEFNHPLVSLAETMDGGADKAAELASK